MFNNNASTFAVSSEHLSKSFLGGAELKIGDILPGGIVTLRAYSGSHHLAHWDMMNRYNCEVADVNITTEKEISELLDLVASEARSELPHFQEEVHKSFPIVIGMGCENELIIAYNIDNIAFVGKIFPRN